MRLVPLDETNLADFCRYCTSHRMDHDESYLTPGDLTEEELLGMGDPACLLIADDGEMAGAVSLMLARFRPLGKGRFRIMHALSPHPEHYRAMLQAVLPQAVDCKSVYLFLPREKAVVTAVLAGLGFTITRHAFLLERPPAPAAPEPDLPAGYSLTPFHPGVDDAAWCEIINTAFATLPAHVDLTTERLQQELRASTPLDGGMIMVLNGKTPIGLARVSRDEDEGRPVAFIEQIAVLPAHQGRGLGRILLRAAIRAGAAAGLPVSQLSVNAENKKALALYVGEGFIEKQTMVCHELTLNRLSKSLSG